MKVDDKSERNWITREYTIEDKTSVFDLRKAVYGEPFKNDEWNWKYEQPITKQSKIFVADHDGQIVGLRPLVFFPVQVKGKVKEQGLHIDVMTHPEFQRRGIFSKLVKEAFNYAKKEGVDFIFTFPNHNSFPSYSKLGWTHICSVPLLVFPQKEKNIVKTAVKNGFFRSFLYGCSTLVFRLVRLMGRSCKIDPQILIKKVTHFDSRYDDLWASCVIKYNICVVRDSKFLNWRYVNKPGENYIILEAIKDNKLAGYIILKSNKGEFNLNLGLIIDIQAIDDYRVTDSLIAAAKEYLQNQNVDAIGCLMLKHTIYYQALRKAGFFQVPNFIKPKEFYFVGHTESLQSEYIYNHRNWYLTFGDIDIT